MGVKIKRKVEKERQEGRRQRFEGSTLKQQQREAGMETMKAWSRAGQ